MSGEWTCIRVHTFYTEHASQPDILVVIGLLFRVVMSNSEIVGNVEQIRLVLACENPLPFRSHVMSFAAANAYS